MATKTLAVPRTARAMKAMMLLPWPASLKRTTIREEWHRRLGECPPKLSLEELSTRLEHSYASVSFWAKKMRYPFVLQKRGRKSHVDWDNVDWAMKNCELARLLDISSERVRQVRVKLNLPPTPKISEARRRFIDYVEKNRSTVLTLPVRTVIKLSTVQISVSMASKILNAGQPAPLPAAAASGVGSA